MLPRRKAALKANLPRSHGCACSLHSIRTFSESYTISVSDDTNCLAAQSKQPGRYERKG